MIKPVSFYFFKRKPIVQKNRYDTWREVANLLGFKAHEGLRVEWMVFYYTVAKKNATFITQHFAISRKTFYKWFKRFKDFKYNVKSLADQSKDLTTKGNGKSSLFRKIG